MKKYEGTIAGILGTIIIHLLGAILFVSMKFHSLRGESSSDFLLVIEEFIPEPLSPEEKQMLQINSYLRSDIDERISNIARNLANTENERIIDPMEYQDRIKEEMIRRGLLGEDNFIDEWRRRDQRDEHASVALNERRDEREEISQEVPPPNYQGPTRVYYELSDRFHTRLPIPVYKCEGGGKVTVQIEVTQAGAVAAAKIDREKSSTTDPCLTDTALLFARSSRFNRSTTAPQRQAGTITYHFVAQ